MNRALVRQIARDSFWLRWGMAAAIITFEILFTRALREIPLDFARMWISHEFFSRFLRMLLGADLASSFTSTAVVTIGFAHPLLYAFTWSLLLSECTRLIIGSVERGVADLLLTLPLSRLNVYLSVTFVWGAWGVVMSLAPMTGAWIGTRLFPLWEPVQIGKLAILCVNLYALYLAIGCGAMCASTFVRRRGHAIAIVLGVLLFSFLMNFLAAMWPAIEKLSAIGFLHYYQPLPLVRDGVFPAWNVAVLLGAAIAFWSVGLARFVRRDIPAA